VGLIVKIGLAIGTLGLVISLFGNNNKDGMGEALQ
jgi:hypothetical protein